MSKVENPPAFPIHDGSERARGRVCSRCGDHALRRQGHQWLCAKHYRFGQMRANARRRGLAAPSHEQLDTLVSTELRCADCGVIMNWLARDGQASVATLQHYRDGSFGIVCRSCNTRHAFAPGDSFRTAPPDHKFCPRCDQFKPLSEFHADRSRSGPRKIKSWCRTCSNAAHRQWQEKNREYYNAKQREGRARRRAAAAC